VWAASNGHKGVVEILLRQGDINPDKPDRTGQTPLLCAARGGHKGVVKILLERDNVPDKPNKYGQTALFCSVWKGHERVVTMLLREGGVSPGEPDMCGQHQSFVLFRMGMREC